MTLNNGATTPPSGGYDANLHTGLDIRIGFVKRAVIAADCYTLLMRVVKQILLGVSFSWACCFFWAAACFGFGGIAWENKSVGEPTRIPGLLRRLMDIHGGRRAGRYDVDSRKPMGTCNDDHFRACPRTAM